MVGIEGIADWVGREVVDRDGEKVGKLADVYYDTADDTPAFVTVKSGALGRSVSVAPLNGATLSRDYVRLDASKERLKDGPQDVSGGRLTGLDALAVLAHYGLPPEPDLEGEERVCFQTAGAAAETERKRAELGAVAVAPGPASEPDAPEELPTTPAPADDDPLARIAELERRVSALERRLE